MIPSGFPIFWVAVPGCSRKGYGESPNFWVQKKFVRFWPSTQTTRLRPTEFFQEFFSYSPFDLFKNLGDLFLSHFEVMSVLWSTVPGIFRCFSRNCRSFSLILQRCHDNFRENFCQWWRLNWSLLFCNKSVDLLLLRGKGFIENKTVIDFKKRYNTKKLQFL